MSSTQAKVRLAPILEALGAAGCAAFFVSACALAFEVQSERLRNQHAPVIRLAKSQVAKLVTERWAWSAPEPEPELTAPEQEAALFAAASALLAPATPSPGELQETKTPKVVTTPMSIQKAMTTQLNILPAVKLASNRTPEALPESGSFLVSGTVSAGQILQFSFRPAEVVFKDRTGRVVEGERMGPRTFRAPREDEYSFSASSTRGGPAMLALLDGDVGPARAVTAVNLESTPDLDTQLDFREMSIQQRRLVGRVLEAGLSDAVGVVGAEIVLVGDSSRVAITSQDGSFDLGEIGVPGGGRVFLEAQRPGGFKHRFEVAPVQVGQDPEQALFLMSEQQIQSWGQSFEGGLSPSSGWIIGAVEGEWSETEMSIQPVVEAGSAESRIQPESYFLDSQNELLPIQGPQSAQGLRWLSIEVPEGAARIGLVDSTGKWLKSTWTPVSPGVINVIPFSYGR